MNLFDKKFRRNKLRYVLQCSLATVSVLVVLLILDALSKPVAVASLGASCFIAFTMPHAQVSRPKFLIGGYLVGVGAGTLCYWAGQLPWLDSLVALQQNRHVVSAAVAVGLAIFVMVVTNTEHPPAAGLALGLALGEWSPMTIVVVLLGIVVLSALKMVLKPVLRSLL